MEPKLAKWVETVLGLVKNRVDGELGLMETYPGYFGEVSVSKGKEHEKGMAVYVKETAKEIKALNGYFKIHPKSIEDCMEKIGKVKPRNFVFTRQLLSNFPNTPPIYTKHIIIDVETSRDSWDLFKSQDFTKQEMSMVIACFNTLDIE